MTDNFDINNKQDIIKLRDLLDSNDPQMRKLGARRVVSLMRSGENMSCLFSSMLRCVKTSDLSLKKLAYLYLVNYSSQEPEQAIMVVNTFVTDSTDGNPIVRALAVRSMCRIKLDAVAEHMIIPLKKSLSDPDPYVRKTAALAVAKIYDIIPEAVENAQILSDLLKLLTDENPMVVSNTATSLFEINERRSVPIFQLDENTVTPIISAMTQCSEWVQVLLLDSLVKYEPSSRKERVFLIERLIPYLKHANPAVVVGAFKSIYHFLNFYDTSTKNIFQQIIPPFITLIQSAEPEVQFVVLRTLSLFVKKYPKALSKEIRTFFCKYNDPSYIKLEKLNIIVTIASYSNVELVLNELEEYCNSVDVKFVRKSIQCIGEIGLKISTFARRAVSILVKLIESKAEYAIEESIVVFSNLLRKFPGEFEMVIQSVCNNLESIHDSRAKGAAIWILGEYSHLIQNVDSLLDPYLDTFPDEPPEVQQLILSALVKLYLRNPETHDQLQFLLNEATKDNVHPDVKDRAMIYWRLLSVVDSESIKESLIFEKNFAEFATHSLDEEVLSELIHNMGSVSGVLHVLPSDFVKRAKYLPEDEDSEENNEEAHYWTRATINDNDVDGFYEFSKRKLWFKVVNKSQGKIDDFAIALNKNWAGLSLASHPKFPEFLDYGDSFEVPLELIYSASMSTSYIQNILQIAIRTNLGTKIFSIEINPFEIIASDPISNSDTAMTMHQFRPGYSFEMDGNLNISEVLQKKGIPIIDNNSSRIIAGFRFPSRDLFVITIDPNQGKSNIIFYGNQELCPMVQKYFKLIFSE